MSANLILYGAKTGNCLRAVIALEEAKLQYTIERVALRQGEHKKAAYLALNPLGQVPILVVDVPENEPSVITQSNAIMFYAAEKADDINLIGQDLSSRAKVFERFFYFLTEVIAPNHASFRLPAPKHDEAAALLEQKALSSLSFAENFLHSHAFIAGDTFSLADIAAFTMAVACKDSLDWDALPRLRKWFSDISNRDTVKRSLVMFD